MLDRPRDPRRDVELRRHDLARLPHLQVVRGVARIHRRPARADRRTQLVRQRRHHLVELLRAAQRPAARDDDLRRREFGAVALGHLAAHEPALARIRGHVGLLHRRRAARGSRTIEAGRAHGDHLHAVAALHRGNRVARVDRALEGVRAVHLGDVADLRDVQLGGHARRHVLAAGRGREQDVAVVAGPIALECQHLGGHVLGQPVLQALAVGQDDLGDARDLGGRLGGGIRPLAGHQHVHVTAAGRSRRDGVQRGGLDRSVVVFCNDECGHSFFSFRSLWLRFSACRPAWRRPAPSRPRRASRARSLSGS